MQPERIRAGKRRRFDKTIKGLIYFQAGITAILLAAMLIYIILRGLPQLTWTFLASEPSSLRGVYGILPSLVNTVYIIVITLVISMPIGVGAAIFLNEYAGKGRIVRGIEFTVETLAGIPSIIYGLFGAVFFGEALRMGYSILTGALTLSIMVLPVVIRTTQEALKTVPSSYREGALALGSAKWHMIRTILLPCCSNGIVTAAVLGVGRIAGESAALLFTAGAATALPRTLMEWLQHPMDSGATLTVQMYFGVSNGKYIEEGFGIALVLLIITLCMNLLANSLRKTGKQ